MVGGTAEISLGKTYRETVIIVSAINAIIRSMHQIPTEHGGETPCLSEEATQELSETQSLQ